MLKKTHYCEPPETTKHSTWQCEKCHKNWKLVIDHKYDDNPAWFEIDMLGNFKTVDDKFWKDFNLTRMREPAHLRKKWKIFYD